MSYGTEKDPIEIMEGTVVVSVPGVNKTDIRVRYLGTQKILTWAEHMTDAKKWDRRTAKAKITKQLEKLPDVQPAQESDHEAED